VSLKKRMRAVKRLAAAIGIRDRPGRKALPARGGPSPRLNRDTRARIWATLTGWHAHLKCGSIIMVWQDRSALDRVGVKHLGEPP
jgi:hypothetical protein